MKLGSKGTFLGCHGDRRCWVCSARQRHAQSPQEKAPMADDVFKSVMLLRGIPVDTFFEAMGMFANSMGNDCTFCHASEAVFDKAKFAESTPRIMKARQMIVMMNAINKQYFAGQTRVTCFTCHGGSDRPRSESDLAAAVRGTGVRSERARDAAGPADVREPGVRQVHSGAGRRRSSREAHELRGQGQLLGIRYFARADSRGNLRRRAEPDDDGHASRDRARTPRRSTAATGGWPAPTRRCRW